MGKKTFFCCICFSRAEMGKTKNGSWVPGSERLTYQAFVERNPGKEEPTMKSVSVVSRSERGCKTQRGGMGGS